MDPKESAHNQPQKQAESSQANGATQSEKLSDSADPSEMERIEYGEPRSLDHETGKIRWIQTDAICRNQSTKCSSAGVR